MTGKKERQLTNSGACEYGKPMGRPRKGEEPKHVDEKTNGRRLAGGTEASTKRVVHPGLEKANKKIGPVTPQRTEERSQEVTREDPEETVTSK